MIQFKLILKKRSETYVDGSRVRYNIMSEFPKSMLAAKYI